MEKKKILVVEDEFITATSLKVSLESLGFEVTGTVDTGEDAIQAAGEQKPDLILMDILLIGDMNGITAAGIIKQKYEIPVIFLTGQSDDATIGMALESEPFGYIVKPFEEKNLKTSIRMALYKSEIDGKVRERDATIQELLNANPEPMFIMDQNTNILVINNTISSRLTTPVPVTGLTFEILVTAGIVSRRFIAGMRDHFFDAKSYHFEEETNGKWISYTLTPLVNQQGQVDRCAVISHDVTWIKRAEQNTNALNLRLEKEKKNLLMFEAMINSMPDFIIGTDERGIISFVNEAFIKQSGYTLSEVKEKHISMLQDPSDHLVIDLETFYVDTKRIWTSNFTMVNKFGLKIKTFLKSTPVIKDSRILSRVFVLRENH